MATRTEREQESLQRLRSEVEQGTTDFDVWFLCFGVDKLERDEHEPGGWESHARSNGQQPAAVDMMVGVLKLRPSSPQPNTGLPPTSHREPYGAGWISSSFRPFVFLFRLQGSVCFRRRSVLLSLTIPPFDSYSGASSLRFKFREG